MEEIILYTIDCPNCKVLEMKLNRKNISYDRVDNREEILKVAMKNNIVGAPILKVGNTYYGFSDAIKYVNSIS